MKGWRSTKSTCATTTCPASTPPPPFTPRPSPPPQRLPDRPPAWDTPRWRGKGGEPEQPAVRPPAPPTPAPPPPFHPPRQYPTDAIAALGRRIDAADGFVVLTAEYNHGYTGVFKNALDHFYVEWDRKPVAFVGWGNVGGARAIEQLRTVSIELGMAPIRPAVHVLPDVMVPAMRAEAYNPGLFAPLNSALDSMIDELHWWATALDVARSGVAA
ncbi:NADPH-dependent FMN reductase [Mycobacterium sp. 3519A]|uniref:NADPH-dependent FMN reductase n=1 Tax=Mycobacterium sp. 3519A TaxID=2057184 RepID=UPI000C7DBA08|nr:NAD(P)H-dependent oxidoreductase [Mycobacterium sp. 3519A]